VRLGQRKSDSALMAFIEWVDGRGRAEEKPAEEKKTKRKEPEARREEPKPKRKEAPAAGRAEEKAALVRRKSGEAEK